jgi:hypothetical protein
MEELAHYSFQFLGSASLALPGVFSVTLHWPLPLLLAIASVLEYAFRVYYPPMVPVPREAAKSHYTRLCVYSAATFLAFMGYVAFTPEEHTFTGFACNPPPTWFRVTSLLFLGSKVWEWRDTVILRGHKSLHDIGFLHIFHHATTVLVWLASLNFPGSEKISYLNAGVHTIMYYHFAYKLPMLARPLITLTQIVQFIVVIAVHLYTVSLPCNHYRGGVLEAWVPLLLVAVYMAYFIRFFCTEYIWKK